jgi:hypothetical protein
VETPNEFNVKLPTPDLIKALITTLEQLYAENHTPEFKHKLDSAKNFIEVIEIFKTQGLIKSNIDLAIVIDTVQKPETIFQAKKSELNSIIKLYVT